MQPLNNRRLLVASFLCLAAAATAQQTQTTAVPRLVRFTGSIHPPANQPAGPISATFEVYSQQEGGTPLWTEDQNDHHCGRNRVPQDVEVAAEES